MPISGGAKVRFENIIVGSLLYIVLNSGLTMMGFTTQMMQLIQGVVFLIFVAVFADLSLCRLSNRTDKSDIWRLQYEGEQQPESGWT